MKRITAMLVITLFFSSTLPPCVQAGQRAWDAQLDEKVAWENIMHFGTLLVGSNTALSTYNPQTGEKMWNRDSLSGYQDPVVDGKDKGIGIMAVDLQTGDERDQIILDSCFPPDCCF